MFDIFGTASKPPKEETGYITVRMPISLRDNFNAVCAKHNVSTSEVIRNFIKQALEQDAANVTTAVKVDDTQS